ncbi:MAG: hypothetical protein E6K53_04295 [Gammaproteobacteria bacterium]|nr:MAG: hypothetical protein E6K53_04295 [Gammaproteobacteria bacterium]
MSANVVNLGSGAHQTVAELLPWFVMATLDADECALVESHLADCAACRRELEWHRQLRTAQAAPVAARDVDRAFAALRARLPAPARAPRMRLWEALGAWWRAQSTPMRWAFALQPLLIVGLAVALVGGHGGPAAAPSPQIYHALARPSAETSGRLVVVFAPQVTQAEMRRVLLASGTRIVDGPTAADAYILAVAPERAAQAAQQLRAESSVLLIQSLDAESLR